MNLILRTIIVLLRSVFFEKKISLVDTSRLYLTVLPTDMDTNFHLNNGRYSGFMDLARLNFAVRSGLYKVLLKERLYGVVASTKINYLKSLLPMEKFTIQTKLVAVDDGWGYIHHDFINKKGKLAASALIKIAFLKKGRRVNFRDIISLVDKRALNLKLSDQHKMFFEAEKEFLEESIASYYSL